MNVHYRNDAEVYTTAASLFETELKIIKTKKNMKNIIIVGGGSVALEVYYTIMKINGYELKNGKSEKYKVLGFLDDTMESGKNHPKVQVPVLGSIKDWKPIDKEVYALGIADPKAKELISTKLEANGCVFETIISPGFYLAPEVQVGRGCFICPYTICEGAKIGNFVSIMGSMIGGEAEIGDYSTTLGFANIATGKLGKRVFVGSQAVILDVKVGDDAVVCVGSIVVRNIKAGVKVFGNPAKKVDW